MAKKCPFRTPDRPSVVPDCMEHNCALWDDGECSFLNVSKKQSAFIKIFGYVEQRLLDLVSIIRTIR